MKQIKYSVVIRIAFKNLWSHRLRTILTVAGVTIGIASIIFLVSLGYGLEKLVTSQVADFEAFTTIDVPSANISTFKLNQESIDKISSFGHIAEIAPVTNLAGRIKKVEQSSTTETIIVGGGQKYWKIARLVPERGAMPTGKDEISLNRSALLLIGEDENKIIGSQISLDIIIPASLRTDSSDGLKEIKAIPLKVVGILEDDKSPIVYTSIDLLQSQDVTKYSSLKIKIDDKENIKSVREQLENIGFSTEYIGDTVNEITQVFSLFRIILAAFGLIALIVAALGTFNTLTISLLEKIQEIGLFKALGMRNKDVYKLFLAESFIIGILGGILGLVLGYLSGHCINIILSFMAEKSNAEPIKMFITPWFFAIGVAMFSVLVSFLTGWYPSKRAVKINALDALRYE